MALDAPLILEHLSTSVNYTLFDTKWVPASARFVTLGSYARGTGALQVFQMRADELTVLNECEHAAPFSCGTFGATTFEERYLATGDNQGAVCMWDLENLGKPVYKASGHTERVCCIDGVGGLNVGNGAPELVTGSEKGAVHVWDPRQEGPVITLAPEEDADACECWSVAFGNSFDDDNRVIAAGYSNGDVKMLDLRTTRMLWETNVQDGVVALQFDRPDIPMNKLAVAGLSNSLRVFDMQTQHPEDGFPYASPQEKRDTATRWVLRHLPQNREVFATSAQQGGISIYKYSYPMSRKMEDEDGVPKGVAGEVKRLAKQVLFQQPMHAMDWHPDKLGLFSAVGLDQTVKVCMVTKLDRV